MKDRKAGVLLHISSLPGPFGIGVFGEEAKQFAEKLAAMGFHYWQILPLGTLDVGNSPYAGDSAFAGNPLFIDPRGLVKDGLVTEADAAECIYKGSPYTADYEFVFRTREVLLRKAFSNFCTKKAAFCELAEEIAQFEKEQPWLTKYAQYKAQKNGKASDALEMQYVVFVQYLFFKQWQEIKRCVNAKGIKIIGDMPIYVAMDSCDVWADPSLFQLDPETGKPVQIAGVPPDYFSEDGQLWGNPLYDWKEMAARGYDWWRERIAYALQLYDVLRIDHFRGLAEYWAVPADAESAKEGHWEDGPGMALFDALRDVYEDGELIAEDLGVFGEKVTDLLRETGVSGMRVVQFGFDESKNSTHLPHRYPENCVAYVGTHDNNTLLGWLWEASAEERAFALRYCGFRGENWGEGGRNSSSCRAIIETVWRSAARIVMISVQDMCGFGSDTRMNIPGVGEGNWRYRIDQNTIDGIDADYFAEINEVFGRK